MPGGLARVAPDARTTRVTNQSGAPSKDVWVLASEPEGGGGFWLQAGPGVEATHPAALPSRAAENLFWLGRYAERAEETIRLVRCVLDRRNEFDSGITPAGTECLDGLLEALTHLTATYPGFVGAPAEPLRQAPEGELVAVVNDGSRPGSLRFSLAALLTSANAVRDQLSVDTWLAVNDLERVLDPLSVAGPDVHADLQSGLDAAMTSLLALAGLATESMVRDPGWAFMDAGRRIERALALASMLRSTLVPLRGTAAESLMLESVLIAAESIITYRRRYRSQAQVETLLDLLLLDPNNPRSIAFQLARLADDVADLPHPDGPHLSPEERALVEVATPVRLADTVALARPDPDTGIRRDLASFLDSLTAGLRRLADALEASHFTHLQLQPFAGVLEPGNGRPAEPGPLDLSPF
ncbi:MAG: circularly permuted type 2 ATP-grasp protein [Acidimicrobiales bacterium]